MADRKDFTNTLYLDWAASVENELVHTYFYSRAVAASGFRLGNGDKLYMMGLATTKAAKQLDWQMQKSALDFPRTKPLYRLENGKVVWNS